jgi:hypothetical protein
VFLKKATVVTFGAKNNGLSKKQQKDTFVTPASSLEYNSCTTHVGVIEE